MGQRRSVIGLAAVSVTAAAAALAVPGSAASAVPARTGAGHDTSWQRYHQSDVTVPAGRACDFEVFEEVVRDREFFRNVSFYADGTPKTQLWKGPLVMRYTNTETGDSVVRDISGRAVMDYAADGAWKSITIQSGHFSGTLPAGSLPERGLFVVGGRWSSLTVNDDGSRTLVLGPRGTAENLCEDLAG